MSPLPFHVTENDSFQPLGFQGRYQDRDPKQKEQMDFQIQFCVSNKLKSKPVEIFGRKANLLPNYFLKREKTPQEPGF